MNFKKVYLIYIIIGALCLIIPSVKAEEIYNENNKLSVVKIGNDYYLLNKEGKFITGWYEEKGNKYYFDEKTGKRVSGFKDIERETYFFSRVEPNKMRTGEFSIDGFEYKFNEDGTMYTGIYDNGEYKVYYGEDGKKGSGFKEYKGNTYFFSRVEPNKMRTGTFSIDGSVYHFDADGSMYTGLYEEKGSKYYFDEKTGKRVSGFKDIEGNTYFFSRVEPNKMRTGTFSIDGSVYHFDADGSMYAGLYEEKGNKYYFDEKTGQRVSGFKDIEGNTYFFSRVEPNQMRTGTFSIDGPVYHFDADGSMHTGLYEEKGNKYYFDEKTGQRVSGFKDIEGKTYFFSRVEPNQMRTGVFSIDGNIYAFENSGEQITGNNEWITINGNKYYMINNIAQQGIQKIGEYKYVFDKTGKLRNSTFTENNKTYEIDSNGHLIKVQTNIKTYYSQKDSRWNNRKYGFSTLGKTGCASTSMAMAFETILDRTILPPEIADYLYYNTNEYNKTCVGSSGMAIVYATMRYAINREPINSHEELIQKLKEGKIVFAAMGNGKFATKTWNHAIVMSKLNDNNETFALDPLNTNNNGWVSTWLIWNEKSTDPDDATGGAYLYALF